jgi:hypothetical protein
VSRSSHYSASDPLRDPARWVPLVLFPLLALFPPKTRGWSMVAGTGLITVPALWVRRPGEEP